MKGPTIVAPELPAPLSIATPPLSIPPFDIELCCKTPPFPVIPSIPSIPITLLPTEVVDALNAAIGQVVDYINAFAIDCPFDE